MLEMPKLIKEIVGKIDFSFCRNQKKVFFLGRLFGMESFFVCFHLMFTLYCYPHSQRLGIVNKAEVNVFLELSCFLHDLADVGNLISGPSAFSKTSLNIRKFTVMGNRWGNSGNSVRLYFFGLPNHCRW